MSENIVLFRALKSAALILLLAVTPALAQGLPSKEELLADRVLGKADAPVTLIEYASLTCPHCATFAMDTLPTIKKEYIDTGKVKLIYRDFPLDRLALTAAMMARCAPEERYFGLIETLFRTQENWARAADPAAALQRLGAVVGLSEENFEACINNRELFDGLVAMRRQAEREYKVNSTPTFILDGRKLTGDQSLAAFRKALDAAVAAKSK